LLATTVYAQEQEFLCDTDADCAQYDNLLSLASIEEVIEIKKYCQCQPDFEVCLEEQELFLEESNLRDELYQND
jgi:hypothetical protein